MQFLHLTKTGIELGTRTTFQLHVAGSPKFPGPSLVGQIHLLVRKSCGLKSSCQTRESLSPGMLVPVASLDDGERTGLSVWSCHRPAVSSRGDHDRSRTLSRVTGRVCY